jgi:hypothetical protein
MDNRLIFLYCLLLVMGDGDGYVDRILVIGLSIQGVEDWRKQSELRYE